MRFYRRLLEAMRCGSRLLLLPAVAIMLAPQLALADYRLRPGDSLDVTISGIQDFRQHVPIGPEGEIGLPLAGQVKVTDMTLAEAREKIAAEMANKPYRQYTADGREILHLIAAREVIVTVSDYGPIFVDGDVAKPGTYGFRPGMTVRQAIAVAGGLDLAHAQVQDPALQLADLQTEYQTIWIQVAGEQARIWRFRAELANMDGATVAKPPIPAGVSGDLMNGEAEQLKARNADRESSKAQLREAISKADLQLGVLAEKRTKDEEGNQADLADYKTVRDLFQKGLAPVTRLSDARRAALLSSEQLLQTVVETSNLERQRNESARQLEKVDNQARIDDMQELQRSNLNLAQLTARLKSASDKMMHVGLLRSQFTQPTGLALNIVVHRKDGDQPQRINGGEDLEVMPGDVISVALPTPTANAALAASASTH